MLRAACHSERRAWRRRAMPGGGGGTAAAAAEVRKRLSGQPFVGGTEPSEADVELFNTLLGRDNGHLHRWVRHMATFAPQARQQWPARGVARPRTAASVAAPPAAGVAPPAATARDMKPLNAMDKQVAAAVGATKALWLEDTYCFNGGAKVLRVTADEATDGVRKLHVVLDQTVFHPQGGGQPSDEGEIRCAGLPPLPVRFVSMSKEDGTVTHDGALPTDQAAAWLGVEGRDVELSVDEARRRFNARLHSAGHVIDCAMNECGVEWVPAKGYHFPEGAYVEYVMSAEQKAAANTPAAKQALIERLNASLSGLIARNGAVDVARDAAGVRNVTIDGTGCACGGTHVRTVGELGEVKVKAMKAKGSNMRVSYLVPP